MKTAAPKQAPAPGYYVSVIDGERRALVSGPFAAHQEALDKVEEEREAWYVRDAKTHWYAWGTARVREGAPSPDLL